LSATSFSEEIVEALVDCFGYEHPILSFAYIMPADIPSISKKKKKLKRIISLLSCMLVLSNHVLQALKVRLPAACAGQIQFPQRTKPELQQSDVPTDRHRSPDRTPEALPQVLVLSLWRCSRRKKKTFLA
jgi:hypothetical protein